VQFWLQKACGTKEEKHKELFAIEVLQNKLDI
jgi:hypothetical protein